MVTTVSVWILGDQLLVRHPALLAAEARVGRAAVTVLLVESEARLAQQRYHRRKLVLILSAMRHYAAALRAAGYRVDLRRAPDFATAVREHLAEHGADRMIAMAAAERGTRALQHALAHDLPLELLPNTQLLCGQHDPLPGTPITRRVVLETFYRAMRRHFGVLLDDAGAPLGGQWNYDAANRRPLPRTVGVPPAQQFAPDSITLATIDEVQQRAGVGDAAGFDLPVTHDDARRALAGFIAGRLSRFGDYEDAMRADDGVLFHSVLSPALNIGLLEPLEVIRAAERAYHVGDAPLNAVEGFVRQILGWREYMYWQYWRIGEHLVTANAWGAHRSLPAFFWHGSSDMHCVATVVQRVHQTGYAHHIERLMILSNLCMLAGITPAHVNDWFLASFVDAYDWVMVPNVFGMGLNADGGGVATKPYIASAAYIDRMSDYCAGCRFNPRIRHGPDACPFNVLYWNFLIAHEARLRANPRFGPAVLGLRHLDVAERAAVQQAAIALLAGWSGEPPP
ncbi:MAG: cryptochrome/photolyase family protein [Chloroflexi bacterium]|nr:cryptochrome/photolyase family protein [Chloroflexota bacterium]